jgi:hypothetical protein
MGVEHKIICWLHRESLPLGKLHDTYAMAEAALKRKFKIPSWLSQEDKRLIEDIRKFRTRHKGCQIQLINDYMDLEDSLSIDIESFDKPIPTQEDVVRKAEKDAVPILENPTTIVYFVMNDYAYKLGAKDRKIKVRFVRCVNTKNESFELQFGRPLTFHEYEGEDGLIYQVHTDGSVGVSKK